MSARQARWRRRTFCVLVAIPEIAGCALVMAWRGACIGWQNVADAWK